MSRSRRKQPWGPITTAISDKPFKKQENQAKRRKVAVALDTFDPADETDLVLPHEKEFGDPWCSLKDGKSKYYSESDLRRMIDATRKSFMNDGNCREHYAFCLRNTMYSQWLIEKLCIFAGIEKDWRDISVEEIMAIPETTIERFIIAEAKMTLKK